jgi:hypothetical protein
MVVEGLGLLNLTLLHYLSVIKLIKTMLHSYNLVMVCRFASIFCKGDEWDTFSINCGISISSQLFLIRQIIYSRFRSLSL